MIAIREIVLLFCFSSTSLFSEVPSCGLYAVSPRRGVGLSPRACADTPRKGENVCFQQRFFLLWRIHHKHKVKRSDLWGSVWRSRKNATFAKMRYEPVLLLEWIICSPPSYPLGYTAPSMQHLILLNKATLRRKRRLAITVYRELLVSGIALAESAPSYALSKIKNLRIFAI